MNLNEFIEQCRRDNQLEIFEQPVSMTLEAAKLCRKEFASRRNCVLLFNRVQGSDFRVAGNLLGLPQRMQQILRSSSWDDLSARIRRLLQQQEGSAQQRLIAMAQKVNSAASSVQQSGTRVQSLRQLPAVLSWTQEVKPYLPLPLTFIEHPVTNNINTGLYRAQVLTDDRLALNISPTSDAGRILNTAATSNINVKVAIVLGTDPAWYWLASAPLPEQCSDSGIYSSLFEPANLMPATTTGIPVPADYQVLLEGSITPDEVSVEGPFGNHTGSYVTRMDCPVMRIQQITRVNNPIIPMTVVGPPPSENINLAQASRCLIRELLRIDIPDFVDISMPQMTAFHGVAIISLRSAYNRNNEQIIANLRGENSPLKQSRLILLVDEDINVQDLERCLWRAINRMPEGKLYQHPQGLTFDATGVDPQWLIQDEKH